MNTENTYRLEPAEAPDQAPHTIATIAMTPSEVAGLIGLLDELDEFLRLGHGIEALTEFYRSQREDPGPRFTASCLVDQVGLTALWLRGQARAASNDQGVHQ